MALCPESINYILIWLREKECPWEIRSLIMRHVKHPVSILFTNEVLKQEKTFNMFRTFAEGEWTWEHYYLNIDDLAELSYKVSSDFSADNYVRGLPDYWKGEQEYTGEICRGSPTKLWWIRKPEPYYNFGDQKGIMEEIRGHSLKEISFGSGIERSKYEKVVRKVLSNRTAIQLINDGKDNPCEDPIDFVADFVFNDFEDLYLIDQLDEEEMTQRIEDTIARPLDEVSLRKNACVNTLVGCRCGNIIHDHEHLSRNREEETMRKLTTYYCENGFL